MIVFEKLKDKIFSGPVLTLAGFIFVLCVSWFYLSPSYEENENEKLHGFLQNQFQNLISDFVAEKHPEVDKITFHKIWTKNSPEPHKVKIFFSYSLFDKGESGGNLLIKGEAVLKRSTEQKLWLVQDFKVKDSFLEFAEPLLIKAPDFSK